MAQRGWLIGLGAVTLTGMLVCAAFSLGVYLGRYGTSAQGIRYNAPAAAVGAAAQPGVPDQPDLIGILRRGSDGALELTTRQGPRLVEVTPATLIVDGYGENLILEDLRPGDVLAVFGGLDHGNGRRFLADRILRVTAPAQP